MLTPNSQPATLIWNLNSYAKDSAQENMQRLIFKHLGGISEFSDIEDYANIACSRRIISFKMQKNRITFRLHGHKLEYQKAKGQSPKPLSEISMFGLL